MAYKEAEPFGSASLSCGEGIHCLFDVVKLLIEDRVVEQYLVEAADPLAVEAQAARIPADVMTGQAYQAVGIRASHTPHQAHHGRRPTVAGPCPAQERASQNPFG